MIDLHCDTISRILQARERGEVASLYENKFHVDLKRLKEQSYTLINFALFVSQKETNDLFQRWNVLYTLFQNEMEQYEQYVEPILCYADLESVKQKQKIATLLTVEEGGVCEGDIEKLRYLYQCGVRMMTITWNYPNELGYPCTMPEKGLTNRGKEFLEAMEEMGMMIDVSHLSKQGVQDVLLRCKKPVVASHSNAYEICSHPRNLEATQLKGIAQSGGVIGLNLYPPFLGGNGGKKEILHQIAYLYQRGGEDCIAIGSDFDGMEGNPWIQGVEDMNKIKEALQEERYPSSIIDKICEKNVERVYREIL